jgi:hypothetical protein
LHLFTLRQHRRASRKSAQPALARLAGVLAPLQLSNTRVILPFLAVVDFRDSDSCVSCDEGLTRRWIWCNDCHSECFQPTVQETEIRTETTERTEEEKNRNGDISLKRFDPLLLPFLHSTCIGSISSAKVRREDRLTTVLDGRRIAPFATVLVVLPDGLTVLAVAVADEGAGRSVL